MKIALFLSLLLFSCGPVGHQKPPYAAPTEEVLYLPTSFLDLVAVKDSTDRKYKVSLDALRKISERTKGLRPTGTEPPAFVLKSSHWDCRPLAGGTDCSFLYDGKWVFFYY